MKTELNLKDKVAFVDEEVRKGGDISNQGQRIYSLESHGIRAVVEDDRMPLMDEELSGRGKITGLNVAKSVVVKFVNARRAWKG